MRSLLRLFAIATLVAVAAVSNVEAQCVSLTTLGSAYTQTFDTLSNTAGSTTNNLTITGWFLTETGGGARDNEQYAVDTGGSNTGDTYSYGSAGSTDRALGGLRSGTLIPSFGVCLTNNTGATITSLDIAYTGEQWRLGTASRTDQIVLEYSLDATGLTTGVWTSEPNLTFTTPNTTTVGAKDGNAAANRTALSHTIPSLSIANGQTFWVRWSDVDAAVADDGLSVDDFSLTPHGGAVLPALSLDDVTLAEGNAGTTDFIFNVSLSAPAGPGGVTFDIATADDTATAGSDYVANSLTGQTIPAGNSTYAFTVLVNGDAAIEPNETFFVNVTNVTGATVADGQGVGTIQNDDSPPDLTIGDAAQPEGDSGTSTLSLTVQLSSPAPPGGVTFDITTSDGTAVAPADYVANSVAGASIATGNTTYSFDIVINGDTSFEPDETITVTVTNVVGANVVDATATATITNDDAAPVLTIGDVSLTEGDAGAATMTFTVTLAPASGDTVTVDYATADSSATTADGDYDAALGTLTFAPSVTTQTLTVTINGDTNSEGNEQFFVNLSNPVNATIGDAQGLGIILLDDPFGIALADTNFSENFDVLAQTGFAATTPVGWTMFESGTNANRTYSAGIGNSNTGDTYSFGAAGSTERAFGGLLSGSLTPTIGAFYRNDTGVTITNLLISFTGEQWRLGSTGRTDRLDFQYSLNATGLNNGTWTDYDPLDFAAPNSTGTVGSTDGNALANRRRVESLLSGLSIAPGQTFWIRWTDFNASGSDDGLAIDDFAIAANSSTVLLSIDDVAVFEGNAGTTAATFTVSLSGPAPPGGVTFDIATADGTATAPSDYTAVSLAAQTITAGSSTYAFGVLVNGDTTVEPSETYFVNVTNVTGAIAIDAQGLGTIHDDDSPLTAIHDIQGPGSSSPIVGSSVTTRGIVTGVRSNGFFIQEPDASVDADPMTSEGILIFTNAAPPAAAAVGNYVQVTGFVAEYVPAADPLQPPLTELTNPTVILISTANPLPAAVPLTATFPDPAGPHDQLERLEGMRVSVASLTVTAPTLGLVNETNATATSTGVFHGVVTGVARPFREPGIPAPDPAPSGGGSIPPIPRFDSNPERIRVDSDGLTGGPLLDVGAGAVVTGLIGPLDYSYRTYTILPDPIASLGVTGGPTATAARVPAADEFTVASFNMYRFFDDANDPSIGEPVLTAAAFDKRLNKASLAIRNYLHAPDVLAVIEMENLTTLQSLAARISADAIADAQPDPLYASYLVEGNDVGGIDVGFLVKTAEVAGAIPRVTVNEVVQELDGTIFVNPDASTSILNDRPPLRLTATINYDDGRAYPITVIVNHLRSLNGANSEAAGTNGWPTEGARVRAKRQKQAEDLANLLATRQTADPAENIVIVGDFNAFEFNDGLVDVMNVILGTPPPDNETAVPGDGVDLVNPDFELLVDNVGPDTAHYSYTFDGSAQNLDHIAINQALKTTVSQISLDHPRIDADFPTTAMNDGTTPARLSDHEPVVAYFALEPVNDPPVNIVPATQHVPEDMTLTFSVANGNRIQVTDVDADPLPVHTTLSVSSGSLLLASTAGLTVTGDGTGTVTLSGTISAINNALHGLAYLPPSDWFGIADLTITTNDLGNSGSGGPKSDTDVVTIHVDAMNDAPVVTGLPLIGTEDTLVVLSGVLVDDVDAGMVQVTVTTSLGVPLVLTSPGFVASVAGSGTPTLVITGSPSAITMALTSVQFMPPAEFTGAATVSVHADDLGNSGAGGPMSASFLVPLTITAVNDAPIVTVPGPQTIPEDLPLAIPGISIADVDADVNPISVTLTTTIGTLTISGAPGVVVTGSGTDTITLDGQMAWINLVLPSLTFAAPAAGGTGEITVIANDLGATGGAAQTDTAVIAITVTDVNDAPTLVVPGAQTTNEGVDLIFSTANGNAISVADIDAGANDVQFTLLTTTGTLTLGSTVGITATGNGTAMITITGPLAAINAALQNLTLSVPTGVGTVGTVLMTIDDLGNTGTGGPLVAHGSVNFTVNDVNDAPTVTVPPAQTTPEDVNLVFSGANAISVSDIDAAGGSIRVTLTTTIGTMSLGSLAGLTVAGNGTATITAEGPVAALNAGLQGLTLVVSTDVGLTGTITVTANDLGLTGSGGPQSATAAVNVTVTDVNDAPTLAVPAAQTTAEGTDLVFIAANGNSISVADVDAGSGAIRISISTSDGTLTLGSTAGLTALAGDGSSSVTMTGPLTALNAAMQGLSYAWTGETGGLATIIVVADDLGLTGTGGPLTATATITVNVTDVNDAPTIAAPAAQTTPEDVNIVFSAANANAISIADADAGAGMLDMTLTTTIGTLTLASAPSLVTTGNGSAAVTATGTLAALNAALEGLTLTVPAATSGNGTLTIEVSDQGNTGTGGVLTATASVAITIDSINDPPVITINATTQDGTSGFVIFSSSRGNGINISDPDADTSPLEVTLTATCGTITLGSTAGLTFTAGDGSGDSMMRFTGTIAAINAALEGMRFTVTPGCGTTATLAITVDDLGATGNNGAQVTSATIQISAPAIAVAEVPTLSFFGLLALGLALVVAAGFRLR